MPTNNTLINSKPIFSTEIPARISDINYGNHLGHDSLISILHEARVQLLNHYGYTELDACGYGMILANINVSYLAQGFYPDTFCINISVPNKSASSLTFAYQVRSNKQERDIATATTIMAFYDYDKKRVVRIPDDFIAKLNL